MDVNSEVFRQYTKMRKFYPGAQAFRAAKINLLFSELEEKGLVRMQAEPEIDYYDDSYIDTWDISDQKKQEEKQKLSDRIERDGLWIIYTQFLSSSGNWETADSCGGFIGDDYLNSGYDVDLKKSAIQALVMAEVSKI